MNRRQPDAMDFSPIPPSAVAGASAGVSVRDLRPSRIPRHDAGLSQGHVLVLSTADWDAPLWTNKQYIALELAREFKVTYVESLGLRRVTLTQSDMFRLARRLRRAAFGGGAVRGHHPRPETLATVAPLVLPFHDSRAARRLNPRLIRRDLSSWVNSPHRVLWTFSPVTYGLDKLADATVYHAVDLMHEYPGHYRAALLAGERELASRGHAAIASSRIVREHLEVVGFRDVCLWENVADTRLFADASGAARPSSRVLFAGNLSPHKVDFELLLRVAQLPNCSLQLAGPTSIDGGRGLELQSLRAAGAILHGTLNPRQLADLAATCVVGLIPYEVNEYTAGVFPMKLYEYLSAGMLVVSTGLPSISERASTDVVVAKSHGEFLEAVAQNLAPANDAVIERRQTTARAHSWEVRGSQARDLTRDLIGERCDVH